MKKADSSAVKVWRIANAIWTALLLMLLAVLIAVRYFFFDWIPFMAVLLSGALIVVQMVWFILIEPRIAYRTHEYQVGETELLTRAGIFIKRETIIPFVRIQNVETQVGPIMKRFNLKSVEVTTAGGAARIELINSTEADQIKKVIDEAVNRLEGAGR